MNVQTVVGLETGLMRGASSMPGNQQQHWQQSQACGRCLSCTYDMPGARVTHRACTHLQRRLYVVLQICANKRQLWNQRLA